MRALKSLLVLSLLQLSLHAQNGASTATMPSGDKYNFFAWNINTAKEGSSGPLYVGVNAPPVFTPGASWTRIGNNLHILLDGQLQGTLLNYFNAPSGNVLAPSGTVAGTWEQ